MTSYKEKARLQREEEILRRTRQLLLEKGYVNLNMDELAEIVGISKPTLYQHFKSKEELVARVIMQDFSILDDYFDQPQPDSPLKQLEQAIRVMLKTRQTGIIANLGFEIIPLLKAHGMLQAHRERVHQHLSRLIENAKATGELTDTLPTPFILRAIFCLNGTITDHHWGGHKPPIAETPESLEERVEHAIHWFFNGTLNTPTK